MNILISFLFLLSNPHHTAIDSFIKANKVEDCLSYLEKHKVNINKSDYLFYKGECHRLKNEYESSVSFFNQALNTLPYDEKSILKTNILLGLSKVSRVSHNHEKSLNYAEEAFRSAVYLKDSLLIFKSLTLKGNAFYAKKQWDSVFFYYSQALKYIQTSDYYNQAVITNNLGNVAVNQGYFKNAKAYSLKASELFSKTDDKRNGNMVLVNYLAFMEEENQNFDQVLWDQVFDTANKNNWLDQKKYLLNNKKNRLLKKINNNDLASLLDTIGNIEHAENDNFVNELNEKFQNEKLNDNLTLKAKELEISKLNVQSRNKWIGLLGLLSLIIAGGSFFYFRYQKTKSELKITEERLKKQQAIEAERNRIASDMHDDIGAGLTRIKFLSDKAISHVKNEEEGKEIQKIASYSNELVRNMGEIIWAMNTRFDNSDNLIAYIRRYASEYLEEHNVELKFVDKSLVHDVVITGERRRNVFLVIKEVLHNIVKYSGAQKLNMEFCNDDEGLKIEIQEIGGKGFDLVGSKEKGNGLFNMEQRLNSINGSILIRRDDDGMVYNIALVN